MRLLLSSLYYTIIAMSNKTVLEEPKQGSKAENASTSYSETGFPVLFHNAHKRNSQHEHS